MPEVLAPVVILLTIGACILVPIWLKHRLYYKQLDTIAKAIEKGVDPNEIKRSLAIQPRSGDINGNWKAGWILVLVGCGFFVLALPSLVSEGFDRGTFLALTPVVLGIALLMIHHRVVGNVVRADEATAQQDKPGNQRP
jgi:hypothetical protein